ncbi:hypothetical protein [Delftia lacustris]|uniref:DUF115 domain-containing protein n=1 Tax=Delftia lacustris TaxID=558537 RepID=A0A1H3SVE2_9BURK|nr:hypothetical protein [Delftia lacustris]SDZ41966.1 hypothetical protein SAMN05421547_12354 [Delftia lacustris]
MKYKQIICLYDLLRRDKSTSEGIFDFIREPIYQATGLHIAHAPGGKKRNGLRSGFDLTRFHQLTAETATYDQKHNSYYSISSIAENYLFDHIPTGSLVLTFEIPPWLRNALQTRGVHYLDICYSPLRFGRDLYFAIDTSCHELRQHILAKGMSHEEIRLEAALLAANVRMHQGRQEEQLRHFFSLDNTLIFIGQHPRDAALQSSNGKIFRCNDFSDKLHDLAKGRRVLHMTDYEDKLYDYAERERAALSELLGTPVRPCMQNSYQVLSSHDDIVVTGISSHVLQEASWFDRSACMLAEPTVQLAVPDAPENGYLQIRFNDLISPGFWHEVLAPDAPAPKLSKLPNISRHYGRESLDIWWDFEKVMTWQRTLSEGMFERMGGGLLRQRVDSLENRLSHLGTAMEHSIKESPFSSNEAIRQLKDSKIGQTAYVIGNGPSLGDFDLEQLLDRESFWCNSAFKMKDLGIEFKPKYYFIGDYLAFQLLAQDVMNVQAGIKFFRNGVYQLARKNHPEETARQNIIWYEGRENPGNDMCNGEDNFSYDPCIKLYSGWSIVLEAIQFAYYMGYSRVYVAGIDLDFSNGYYFWDKGDQTERPSDEVIGKIHKSFLVAKGHFEKNGRILAKISNSPKLPLDYVEDASLRRT